MPGSRGGGRGRSKVGSGGGEELARTPQETSGTPPLRNSGSRLRQTGRFSRRARGSRGRAGRPSSADPVPGLLEPTCAQTSRSLPRPSARRLPPESAGAALDLACDEFATAGRGARGPPPSPPVPGTQALRLPSSSVGPPGRPRHLPRPVETPGRRAGRGDPRVQPAPRCVQATGRARGAPPAPAPPAPGTGGPERPEAQATPSAPGHALGSPRPAGPSQPPRRRGAPRPSAEGGPRGSCGSGAEGTRGDRADRGGDPAPGRCGAPEPFGLTTRLSSGSSCGGKCQGGFFFFFLQAPVRWKRIPCPLMAIITNIWGSDLQLDKNGSSRTGPVHLRSKLNTSPCSRPQRMKAKLREITLLRGPGEKVTCASRARNCASGFLGSPAAAQETLMDAGDLVAQSHGKKSGVPWSPALSTQSAVPHSEPHFLSQRSRTGRNGLGDARFRACLFF